MFNNVNGNKSFQPISINWSYLGLGKAALNSIKKAMNIAVLNKNQNIGGRKAGPSQPPKNIVAMRAEIKVMPRYSPTKNNPNFIPEYSA